MGVAQAVSELCPQGQWVIHGEETYDNIQWLSDDITMPTEAEVNVKVAELEAAKPMKLLREKRGELLKETDHFALVDVTLTDEMKAYRQALRDLPATTADPADPVWPVKPS